jgi:glutaconate CoA-transferase, subunit B
MNAPYTTSEFLAVLLARDLRDGERGAAGAAAMIPMAAILLARRLHAPNLEIAGEMFVNPAPRRLWSSMLDDRALGSCEAAETFVELFGHSHRGLDFFFHSGLQYDRYGNINLHALGPFERPNLRGPGAANISYGVRSRRFYICATHHSRRNFVPKVDFITVPGHLDGPQARAQAGLVHEGPRYCLTPRCVFDFDPATLAMRLKSLHPGHSLAEVVDATGFSFAHEDVPAVTVPPSAEELRCLREEIDPRGDLRAADQKSA